MFPGADTLLAIKEATRNALLLSANFEGNMCLSFEHLQSAIAKTKPSSIRGVTMEVPSVKWDDIGGMQQVKNQLREAIELPVAYPDLYEALCIRPAKGVLLYGPPGCSKTLMARALATEGGMNFLAVKVYLLINFCIKSCCCLQYMCIHSFIVLTHDVFIIFRM